MNDGFERLTSNARDLARAVVAPPTRFSDVSTRSLGTEQLFEALISAGLNLPYPIQTLRLETGPLTGGQHLLQAAGSAGGGRQAR